MADPDVLKAIEVLQRKVAHALETVTSLKRAANALADAEGLPPVYSSIDDKAGLGGQMIRQDQFTNHSAPSSAARAFLEWRGKDAGAVMLEEIYDALKRGGYFFEQKEDGDAKAALRIALGKDIQVLRLPNGAYGLAQWYDRVRRDRDEQQPSEGPLTEPKRRGRPPKIAAAIQDTVPAQVEAGAFDDIPF